MGISPRTALLALSLFACAACAASPTTFSDIWGANGENWGAVALTAAVIALFFPAIPYMIGMGFGLRRLTVWAKDELYQGIASLLILTLVIGFVYGLGNLSGQLAASKTAVSPFPEACGGDADCRPPGEPARCAQDLDCPLGQLCITPSGGGAAACSNGFTCVNNRCTLSCANLIGELPASMQAGGISPFGAMPTAPSDPNYHITCARKILNFSQGAMVIQADNLLNLNIRMRALSGFSKFIDISPNQETGQMPVFPCPIPCHLAFGFSVSPYAGVTMLSEAVAGIMPFLFSWIASFIAQEFMLRMIQESVFPVLLALGIILRTLFFTRRLGGLLMAVAIGLYTVYPLMYILLMDNYMFDESQLWLDKWDVQSCTCDTTRPWWASASDWLKTPEAAEQYRKEVCPVRFCTPQVATILTIGVGPELMGIFDRDPLNIELEFAWLYKVISVVGQLIVPGFMIPIIIGLVTVSFIKTLSPLLGGDIEIAGLTHLL
ncbi:MAG: hypothetical protein PHF51_01060 [Candidatus ainarchaeum sp.]|nr:hypothetical protein [Candidatus ainarchaeum sp.]